MKQLAATLIASSLIAVGGFVAGKHKAEQCPQGFTRGVAQAFIGAGFGVDAPAPRALWEHTLTSACFRRVTLPVVRLMGGPFDGAAFFEEFTQMGSGSSLHVVSQIDTDPRFGRTLANTADGSVTFENGGTEIAVRPRTTVFPSPAPTSAPASSEEDPGATTTFGPASHYRLSDGVYLGTDPG